MAIGKSISFFLIDGSVDGVIACELYNWTGKAYKVPRSLLKTVADRDELWKAGVYFLLGHDDSDRPTAYIGEAEEAYKRLTQHQDREFWSEAIVFISKDENLNKAHIKYLEYTLHREALDVGRYRLSNGNTPNKPAISEADRAVMMEFSENLRLIIGTLGYKLFEPLTKRRSAKQTYRIEAARGAKAQGIETAEGFVVLKGSRIASSDVPSIPVAIQKKRELLLETQEVVDWTLVADVLFSSPSTAAAVVMGRSANGLVEWVLEDGTTLKDNQAIDAPRT